MTRAMTLSTALLIATLSFTTNAQAQENEADMSLARHSGFFATIGEQLRSALAELEAKISEARSHFADLLPSNTDDGEQSFAKQNARTLVDEARPQARNVQETTGDRLRARGVLRRDVNAASASEVTRPHTKNNNGRRVQGANSRAHREQGVENLGRRVHGAFGQALERRGQGRRPHAQKANRGDPRRFRIAQQSESD